MPSVKQIAVSLWASIVEYLAIVLKVAMKSLYFGPFFYGFNWLIFHSAPSHDMWFGFIFAAIAFTTANKKASRLPNKEKPQRPPSPIFLPASMTSSANPPR